MYYFHYLHKKVFEGIQKGINLKLFWGGGGGGVDKASFEVNCILCRKWNQLKIESRIKFDSVHFKGNTFIASIDQKWPVVWKNTSQTYLKRQCRITVPAKYFQTQHALRKYSTSLSMPCNKNYFSWRHELSENMTTASIPSKVSFSKSTTAALFSLLFSHAEANSYAWEQPILQTLFQWSKREEGNITHTGKLK